MIDTLYEPAVKGVATCPPYMLEIRDILLTALTNESKAQWKNFVDTNLHKGGGKLFKYISRDTNFLTVTNMDPKNMEHDPVKHLAQQKLQACRPWLRAVPARAHVPLPIESARCEAGSPIPSPPTRRVAG